MKAERLTATESRDGLRVSLDIQYSDKLPNTLRVSLDIQYSDKLPNAPVRKKAALEIARRIIAELEAVVEGGGGRLTGIGSADNGQTRTRRDDWLVERKDQ